MAEAAELAKEEELPSALDSRKVSGIDGNAFEVQWWSGGVASQLGDFLCDRSPQ